MSLGAYYQVYKNKEATEWVLSNFRKVYPTNPIYLVSDNGLDFSEIAAKYNCAYEFSSLNTGYKDHTHSESYGFTKQEFVEYMARFKRGSEYCNTDYIIYLEDDVLVRKPITIPLDVQISGVKVGNKIQKALLDYIKLHGGNNSNDEYGACGGAIINNRTFTSIFDKNMLLLEKDYDYIKTELCPNFGWLDLFMVVFFMMGGYDYQENKDLVESHRNHSWINSNHAIVHGIKNRI